MLSNINQAITNCKITNESVLKSWKEAVDIESYSYESESVKTFHNFYKQKLEDLGLTTRSIFFKSAGPVLIGEYGQGNISDGIILSGHMDTVYKLGTITERPFTVKGNKVTGPGVLDMKGGLNIILYILQILKKLNYTKIIKVIICGDEENGHINSNAPEIIKTESSGYKCAFNMETGLINNGITVARKGRIGYTIKVYGKSAHAGANFDEGISAITELASTILKIDALNQKYENVTFCIGTMKGGSIINAVAGYAEATVDIRYTDKEKINCITKDIENICNNPVNKQARIQAICTGNFNSFTNTSNRNLYEIVNKLSIDLGMGKMPAIKLGGSSDAAYLSDSGLPVLCSMGVKGEWNHTEREYALADSALERIKLICAAIFKLENITLN